MDLNELLVANKVELMNSPAVESFFRAGRALFNIQNSDRISADNLFELLCNSAIRRGEPYFVAEPTRSKYIGQIDKFVTKHEPIEFVFIGFPFKCHNPIETLRKTPDLGELSFLLRLSDINATVKQIYSPGVRFTILTEGNAYKDLFGASTEEISKFEERLNYFVLGLEAKDMISFADFDALCKKVRGFSQDLNTEVAKIGKDAFQEDNYSEIQHFVPMSMRSLPILEKIPLNDLISVYDDNKTYEELNKYQRSLRDNLSEKALVLARRYVSFQRLKNKYDIVKVNFPDKIYISTTSKMGRYSFHPIHRRTRYFPHHGVPVLGSDKVDIVFFQEILKSPRLYKAVYCSNDPEDSPFYFLRINGRR